MTEPTKQALEAATEKLDALAAQYCVLNRWDFEEKRGEILRTFAAERVAEARRAAIEECARVADLHPFKDDAQEGCHDAQGCCEDIAGEIRALAGKPAEPKLSAKEITRQVFSEWVPTRNEIIAGATQPDPIAAYIAETYGEHDQRRESVEAELRRYEEWKRRR